MVCEAGDLIPSDGEITEGVASVDESAITGESAPVIREAGGDRSAVTGGTRVLSDRIVVRITAERGKTFLDRMIALVEGANRQQDAERDSAHHPARRADHRVRARGGHAAARTGAFAGASVSVVILIALLVCLIPTTIGALLSAIGIAGMDRLVQRNVLAMSGRAVEAAGDVQTLLLDKTGTITLGNRMASAFHPVDGHSRAGRGQCGPARLAGRRDPRGALDRRARQGAVRHLRQRELGDGHVFVPFSAQTRMSGLDFDGRRIRKGAADAVRTWVIEQGGQASAELDRVVGADRPVRRDAAGRRRRRRTRARRHRAQGHGQGRHPRALRRAARGMGIRTVMITGDNPLTAAAIAQEAGVDDYLAEATPEAKMNLIKAEQQGGKLVAMTGDGTNDAPALAQADVGVAMNTGTTAAKEAGNMVDLDSNPTKLIDIVEIGKQLLITRGALTTFSIANDVAKYFAIIPALFVATYPQLERAQHHGPAQPAVGRAVRGDLQRPGHRRADPAGAARRAVPPVRARPRSCAATSSSTASAGSSCRSSSSSSSISSSPRRELY